MIKRLRLKDDVDLSSGVLGLDQEDLKRQKELFREFEGSQQKKRKRLRRQAEKRKEVEKRESLRRKEQRQRREDERIYGPQAIDLIRKAYEDGVEYDFSCRFNVVGNYHQGKTSLVEALVGNCDKSIYSTNGIDIARYKCRRDASGEIIYDETHGHDPADMAKRINATQSLRKYTIRDKIKYIFTSTYKKLWGTNNPSHLPKDMTEEEKNMLIQTVKLQENSKDDIIQIMDIWDFAGQIVYYATHTLFHSRKAIYLLVFNLSLKLSDVVLNDDEECRISHGKRTMEYYIKFWVNSVRSFVGNEDGTKPIIILVGTHMDKLEGDNRDRKRQADEYFDNIRSLFKGKQALKHIYRKDFALDTKDLQSKTLRDLRDTLINLGNEMTLSVTVPAKWIQLEKCLFERRGEKIVKFSTIVEIDAATEYPLKEKEHIKLFLKHKHDQGALVYFDEEPISQYVVLDPQFLVDAFKSLITAKRFVTNRSDVYEAWMTLSKEGKLESTLIDKLWAFAKKKDFIEHKETILWFLQKHRIISQALKFDEKKQKAVGLGWYVVPSLLPDHVNAEEISNFQKGKVQTKVQYVISFDNSAIVPTVYSRLTAAVLGRWSILEFRGTKLLFENISIVQMDSHHAGVIRFNDKHIHLTVMSLTQRRCINKCISDGFRRFAESVVMHEFRKHHGVKEQKILPFTRGYSCNDRSHNLHGGSQIKQFDSDLSINCSTCPDFESHEIDTACATAEWFLGSEAFPLVPSGCPSNETFAMFSQCIGKNWEILASTLGIPQVKIDHIKYEENSTVKQIYKTLCEWREMKDENVSLTDLLRELRRLPTVRVNWDRVRNIMDELNRRGPVK